MKKELGFTLIEIILFIVISSILATGLLLIFNTTLIKSPQTQQQIIAVQTAQKCMEWFLGQRNLNGYSTLSCPSTPSPTLCSAPSGYTISNSISCTTINSDSNYKTITVTVGGNGDAVLTSLIADY